MHIRNITALTTFVLFYVSFGAFLTLYQERIVYQPSAAIFGECPALAEAERVTHRGTRMYANISDGPIAVLYHGNAGSACDRAFYAQLFTQAGYGYLLVEYAGYGGDPQPPTHDRIYQDVHNVIDYLQQSAVRHVTLIGESIGTGVASYHAALQSPDKLLLITPFTDLHDIARGRFWFYPTGLLVDNVYDNRAALAVFENRVVIIHGDQDSVIPYRLGKALYDSLSADKTFVTIAGASHNNLFGYPETFNAVETFLSAEAPPAVGRQ
jgi:pimeloyl-ACP methyl ester carboxylesterase